MLIHMYMFVFGFNNITFGYRILWVIEKRKKKKELKTK